MSQKQNDGICQIRLRYLMKSAKCFLTILVTLALLFSTFAHALAHIPCQCNNPPDLCNCFIQLGDKGPAVKRIISLLEDKGYLSKPHKKSEFTLEVKEAVTRFQTDNHLECTGWMDDETLDALLFNILPDPSVKYEEERWSDVVFIPTDGGIRYHLDPECCEMNHPRLITRVNAEKIGIKHCGLESASAASGLNILSFSSAGLGHRVLPDDYYIEEESLQTSGSPSELPSCSNNTKETYIGNKNSRIFHHTSCSFVKKMSEKNKIEFISREEAIEQGFEPCDKCNP